MFPIRNIFPKFMLLITVMLMDVLVGMEFDLFVPSFPELQNRFILSSFWVEALLSINFIGYCLSLFFVGLLADRYGRKSIILFGLLIFIGGSVFCLLDVSSVFLFLGRFLQGVGIAAPAILSFVIIADSYPLKKQQFILAMMNGSMNIATAFAPVIGSYVSLYFHWQGNFIVLLLLGLMVLIMTLFFIPKNKISPHEKDTIPNSYFSILRSKFLLLMIISVVFMFVPYWIFVGMSPLLYIKALNVSLAHFGYYQGVLALIFALGSIIYGLVINHFDQRKMLVVSSYIFIIAFVMLAFLSIINSINPLFITLAFMLFVLGQIFPSTILYPLCLEIVPQAKGKVTAIIASLRLILSSFGLQLAGYFYQGSFQNIGFVVDGFILLVIITQFWLIKNPNLRASLLSQ